MIKKYQEYFDAMLEIIEEIRTTQGKEIETAAEIASDAIAQGGIIHTFGTGHSHCISEDISCRGGTLAPIHAILEPSMTGSTEIMKAFRMEKLEGAGAIIVEYHRVLPPDAIIIVSNSGNNAASIDVAREARARGVKVIAVSSVTAARSLKPLHSSGKMLIDFADVVVDNCGRIGDICLNLEGMKQGLGATSTVTGAFILQSICVQAAANLKEKGIEPPVFWNGMLEGSAEHNQKYIDRYWNRIRNA